MNTRGYSSQTIHEISENVNIELVEFYNSNASKNKYYPSTFYDLVRETIEDDIKSESEAEELRRMYNNKKRILMQKKKRQYESCRKMVETRAWEIDDLERYCFKADILNYNSFTTGQWNTLYDGKSLEDLQQERLQDVENWYKNPESFMIQYPGQERKTPKRQFDNYKSDLAIAILATMKRLYNWDMENLTFPVMDDLTDKPVFSAKRETLTRSQNGNKNSVVVFSSEDGRQRTVITFEDAAFGNKESTTLFDYKDSSILSYLLRAAIKYDGTTMPILIEKIKLIRAAYGRQDYKPTKRDYEDIDNRLRKLSQAYIETFVDNEWSGTFHMVEGIEKQDIDSRKYVAFYPSDYMTKQIENNGVSQLPTDLKNKLSSDAAKLLYAPLMVQRVKAYKRIRSQGLSNDSFKVAFQYGHFLRFANFGKGNQQDNHKAIMTVLEEYKSKDIFIQDYSYTQKDKVYTLTFKPLTDIEIQDLSYYFGDEYAIDNLSFQQIGVLPFVEN